MMLKKRFIAGAVCPRCKSMDTIFMYREDDKNFRECVACDFKDQLRLHATPNEIVTRVNVTEEAKAHETQAIRIIGSEEND